MTNHARPDTLKVGRIRRGSNGYENLQFQVVVEPDEDFDGNASGWHVYCPALVKVGGSTWGETEDEALKNIGEVVRMIVEEFIADGAPYRRTPRIPSRSRKFR